jgi:hypothetical protein
LYIFSAFAICCLLITGCKTKEVKNPPRCIYDQPVFAAAFLDAANDDDRFMEFKKNPFFNLLWENLSFEEGQKYLDKIENHFPFLKEKFEMFRTSDHIGSPRTYAFGKAGAFSPSTLRLIALSGEMQLKVGDWKGLHVVQIGAGYGELCKILYDISKFESYTLVDLPEQLSLAKKYLACFGVRNVTFLTPEQLSKEARYDWAISDMSFSEFNRPHQLLFIDRIVSRSSCAFLLGRIFPKHYGVVPMNLDELKSRLEKGGKFSKWEVREPTIEDENYLICFKN